MPNLPHWLSVILCTIFPCCCCRNASVGSAQQNLFLSRILSVTDKCQGRCDACCCARDQSCDNVVTNPILLSIWCLSFNPNSGNLEQRRIPVDQHQRNSPHCSSPDTTLVYSWSWNLWSALLSCVMHVFICLYWGGEDVLLQTCPQRESVWFIVTWMRGKEITGSPKKRFRYMFFLVRIVPL